MKTVGLLIKKSPKKPSAKVKTSAKGGGASDKA